MFEYLVVITAEPRASLPFWEDFYHDTGSIYNSIIFYSSFTIKLRVVSLMIKYLGMAVTLQLFDIENIKSISFIRVLLKFAAILFDACWCFYFLVLLNVLMYATRLSFLNT